MSVLKKNYHRNLKFLQKKILIQNTDRGETRSFGKSDK